MSSNPGYVIQVGHYSPEKVVISVPTKEGNPGVNVAESFKTVGEYNIINRARVWGRRVLDNGKLAKDADKNDIVVEVTNKDYHGKIEFLDWGVAEQGAQAIEVRYLPQSLSLDVEYQDNIQKIKLDPEGKDGSAFLVLTAGRNTFDYKTQALLIQMYKVHPQNRDSKSKNPDPRIKGYTFWEVTDADSDKVSIAQSESKITSGNYVMALADKPNGLRNLMNVFVDNGVGFGDVNLLSVPTDIYKALLIFAEQRPGDFGLYINEFKKEISDCFEKAKSYKALDLTTAGTIGLMVNSKKEIMFDKVEGKEEGMLTWVLEHFLDDSIFDNVKKFKDACEKLKS